jgi:hypothetical protein
MTPPAEGRLAPREESSTLVSANRRRTVVVLTVSAALLAAAFGWAALVGRDRPSPAELAAREYYTAVLDGDCDLAQALLTRSRRDAIDETDDGACAPDRPRSGGRVTGATTERTGDAWAIVVVRADTEESSRESVLPLGLRYEKSSGRWQVDRISPQCVDADRSAASGRCERWDWP